MYCREGTLDDSRREKNDCDWASTTSKNWRCTIFSPGAGWRTFPRIYFIRRCAVVSATYVRPPRPLRTTPRSAHYSMVLCPLHLSCCSTPSVLLTSHTYRPESSSIVAQSYVRTVGSGIRNIFSLGEAISHAILYCIGNIPANPNFLIPHHSKTSSSRFSSSTFLTFPMSSRDTSSPDIMVGAIHIWCKIFVSLSFSKLNSFPRTPRVTRRVTSKGNTR
jgi:hypothetical protein